MLIQGTSITVTYKKIQGIKKAYYNNEEILKEYFNEATVLPVPDDAPVEIPRIMIKTLHEHAQLNISPIAATFEVKYDAGFERNWKICSEYITERMIKVFEFLNLLTDNNYNYVGLISNVLYDDISQGGADKLSKVLLNSKKIKGIYDINIRYTFIEEQNMFVNITLQNARMFKNGADPNSPGALKISEQMGESIGATIDINDRYGFNTNDDYRTNSSKLQELISCMTNIMDNKLSVLIEKGVY